MKTLYKYRKLIVGLAVLALILALAPLARGLSVEKLLRYRPASLPLAALLLVGVYCVKSVVMVIPTYGLYIVGGLLFPPGVAILLGYAGLACELTLGFLLGRWLGQEKVTALAQKNGKAGQFLGYLGGNSQMVCFVTRVLPMPYPVDLGSMIFGATGMPFFSHLLFSLLGLSAVMIPITLAGGHLDDPLSAEFLVPFGVSLVLCVALMVVYRLWRKKQAQAGAAEAGAEAPKAGPEPPEAE